MRLYSEKEIGAILKRTAELSKRSDRPYTDGLSLEEIQQLAEEAGLDPNLVSQAAVEMSGGAAPAEKRDLFGGPLSYSTDIELDVDVDGDTWETMLSAVRRHFNDPGTVSTREGVREWTTSGGEFGKKGHVYVRKTRTGSRLHIFWSETTSAVPFYIPTMLSVVLTPVLLFEEASLGLIGIPVMLAIVGAVFMLCRLGVITMKKRYVGKIEQLGKDLSRMALEDSLARRSERPQNSLTGANAEARIELDSIETAEDEEEVRSVRSRDRE